MTVSRSTTKQVISFLHENVDFFAAPFIQNEFQTWAKEHERQISQLTRDLIPVVSVIRFGKYPFINALVGANETDRENSLLNDKTQRIKEFFKRFFASNSRAVAKFHKHLDNTVITKWYQTEASDEQYYNRLRLQFKKACTKYKKYLQEQIKQEFYAIDRPISQSIIDALGSTTFFVKKKFLPSYCNNENRRQQIDGILAGSPSLATALKKYQSIDAAERILQNPDKQASSLSVISSFFQHLEKNDSLLTQRRDSGFVTFLKGLGVVAATLAGFIVGGFVAYKFMFGSRASRGQMFFNEVADIRDNRPPRSSRPSPR